MEIPSDPFMLLSFVNMKLRDNEFESLEELCSNYGVSVDELKARLQKAGFEFIQEIRQFR